MGDKYNEVSKAGLKLKWTAFDIETGKLIAEQKSVFSSLPIIYWQILESDDAIHVTNTKDHLVWIVEDAIICYEKDNDV